MTTMTSGPARKVFGNVINDDQPRRISQARRKKLRADAKNRVAKVLNAFHAGVKEPKAISKVTGVNHVLVRDILSLHGLYETPSAHQLRLMKEHPEWDSLRLAAELNTSQKAVLARAYQFGITLKRHYVPGDGHSSCTSTGQTSLTRRRGNYP